MSNNFTYTIVVPTYNEKDNVPLLLAEIEELFQDSVEIIIADGNSSDGTLDAVKEYAGENKPHIKSFNSIDAPGLSECIVKGFDMASGKYCVCMDGDLQHDPAALPAIFEAVKDNDIVVGSRHVPGGEISNSWGWSRRIISKTATKMTQFLLKVDINDPMSGFFAVQKESYLKIRDNLNPKGFKIMLEVLYRMKKSIEGSTSKEVPITFRTRKMGESKLSSKVIFEFISGLWDLRRS
jgi:dolichol-phosphate mannosyltransferase